MNTLTNERLEKLKGMASVSQLPALGIQPAELQEMVSRLLAAEAQLASVSANYDKAVMRNISERYQKDAANSALVQRAAELEAQLAELRGQAADAEIKWDGSEFTVQNVRDGFSYGVTPVFIRPVPPAASQPSRVTPVPLAELAEGIRALHSSPASQPYTVPDYYVVVTKANVWQTFCKTRAEADFIVSKPFHKGYYVLEVYTRRAAMLQAGNFRENENSSTKNCRGIAETSTECPTSTLHGALLRREEFAAELESMTPEQRQAHDKAIADFKSEFLPNSPVIPDGWVKGKFAYDTLFNAIGKAVNIQGEALSISVKAFEDAMLAAAPQHKGE
ncbi:hypothetical protein [Pectobacterium brasiliense]|uniref:hypothetical protein n=1 Tax=Pectobacterium brasiliense TaxID=180957 RepID=UPI0005801DBC|nr:hypothetical protein [Pectobacterium brasiliense]KHT21035.1 hypothetical protein RC97_03005 [Pectobacterium brasiliense]